MNHWNRRAFLEYSTAALLTACARVSVAQGDAPKIIAEKDFLRVQTARYTFLYELRTDIFQVLDGRGRCIASGPLQPLIRVSPRNAASARTCAPGKAAAPSVIGSQIGFKYEGINGNGQLNFHLRFTKDGFWMDPLEYANDTQDDVVSVHYFANYLSGKPTTGLVATYLTVPGIAEGDAVSPIQDKSLRLEQSVSLGHSGFYVAPYTHQQWALPVHYFCATSTSTQAIEGGRRDTYSRHRSETLTCGLADLPNGDMYLDLHDGRSSMWIEYRADLWHHLCTPGTVQLGATLAFSLGEDQYGAITAYYMQLLSAGIITRKQNSSAKNAVAAAPQFCTWGAQVMRNAEQVHLTQPFVESLFGELKASGMKARLFSIDDKWEGRYGNLEHDAKRFPTFEAFLDRIRSDGYKLGLWAAFMRCEDPADLGLELSHMLQKQDGTPYRAGTAKSPYYILDLTQPAVEAVLRERARAFMRRYKPDLVKFDFGYELPALRDAAPANKQWAGERLLKRGLDIVVGALRTENPDVVIMYYQLSPLFVQYFDLHSTDDLYLVPGDYDLEANRRIYFGSILSKLGVSVYGSSGYDWSSSPKIWFDSVASGTIGSLNDFDDDEFGEHATTPRIALYNGLAATVRVGNNFEVVPFPPARPEAPERGGHARSWARIEDGGVTLIAQQPPSFDDGDMLDHRPIDIRVRDLLTTSAPVVVASMTSANIGASERLAVVACAEGTITLKRSKGTRAAITTHLFGGRETKETTVVHDGALTLTLRMLSADLTPIEWVEVIVS